jgi:putative phosphoribosyl transferase
MASTTQGNEQARPVEIPADEATLAGILSVPPAAVGIVLFAHGSGSGRFSPRNRAVAQRLEQAGLATLLMDLLTSEEEAEERYSGHLRFDIELLAKRLRASTDWICQREDTRKLGVGYFGASTGAAAALAAAAAQPERVQAVVSRGGRPDLAGDALPRVEAPTLLIVGGNDPQVLRLNQQAQALMRAEHSLQIIPGATHLFEEPGALEEVARLARQWFTAYLRQAS